jgi:hypothetical protein
MGSEEMINIDVDHALARMLWIGAVVAAPLIGSDQAQAKDITGPPIAAASGKQTRLSAFWSTSADCGIQTVNLKTTVKPKNGTLIPKVITRKIVASTETNFDKRCVGKSIKAIEIFYKSTPGFKGKDRVKLTIKDNGETFNYIFNMIVK